MVAVYLIAVIVILLAVLLFLPIKATVCIDSEKDITVEYLGFTVYPTKQKKKIKKEKAENNNSKNKENAVKKVINKKGLSGGILEIIGIIKDIISSVSYILKHIKIREYRCITVVASDDAAKTAVEYGIISAAINGLTAFISSITNLKIDEVKVNSDFSSNKPSFRLFCIIGISPIFAVIAATKVAFKIIKFKKDVQDDE